MEVRRPASDVERSAAGAIRVSTQLEEMTAELHRIAQSPPDDARALPGAFYCTPEFFDLEVALILSKEWHCLGRADEIPQPGDYLVAQLFKEPLLVCRGDDAQIRVFSNVCRHRGMRIAAHSGSAQRFVCPYHGWSYGRDGAGSVPPRMRGSTSSGNCRLPEFRSELWNGFIYVNLDDAAAPLAPRLRPLDRLLENYEPERMRVVHVAQEEWRTNWKCLVENFMEAYHLSAVHPHTLRPYTPTELSQKTANGEAFTSYAANYPASAASRGIGAAKLSREERSRSTLFCVFPAHVASQAATLLASMSIQPIAVDRLNVRWTLSTYENELTPKDIAERIALWTEVNREDREVLERLQTSLASRHATCGPLAAGDFEGAIFDFTRYLATRLGAGPATASGVDRG